MSFNKFKLVNLLILPIAALVATGCGSDAYVKDGPDGICELDSNGCPIDPLDPDCTGDYSHCTVDPVDPVGPVGPGVVPDNMTIDTRNPVQYIMSVCDYRTTPETVALGVIDNGTNKITQPLHYTVAGDSAKLGKWVGVEVTLPTSLSQDGEVGATLTLSWPEQTVKGPSGYIQPNIRLKDTNGDGRFLVKCNELDGNYYGQLLAILPYPVTSSASSDLTIKATAYVISDDGGEIYPPVVGPDGSFWLKHNLEADYVTVGNPNFNPDADITSIQDVHAYGNLWQWGRKSEGHQLINYPAVNLGSPVNGTTTTKSNNPANALFILSDGNWRTSADYGLWNKINTSNQVCPKDWRLGTEQEWRDIRDGEGAKFGTINPPDFLQLTLPGIRKNTDGLVYNTGLGDTFYWTGDYRGDGPQAMRFDGGQDNSYFSSRVAAEGGPVRCRYGKAIVK